MVILRMASQLGQSLLEYHQKPWYRNGLGESMESKANDNPIQELIDYHKWWVEKRLSLYEKIASKLWPPTDSFLDSFTPVYGTEVKEEEKNGKKYTIQSFGPDTLHTNMVLLEGLVLHLTAIWEALVTNTIVLLFAQDTSNYSRRFDYRLEKTISVDVAWAIVIGDRYLDFGTFAYIKSIEKKFLAQDLRPFTHVPEGIQKLIDQIYIYCGTVLHTKARNRDGIIGKRFW